MTETGEKRPRGRPPLSNDNEVINVIVPKWLMSEVREHIRSRGATIAGWVRLAMEDQLEREEYRRTPHIVRERSSRKKG
jgi:hypothetical protein